MPQTLTCTATSNSGGALHQPPRRASLVCHCATVPHPTPHHAGTAGWSTHIHIHTQPHPHPHMLLSPSSTYAAREMCALASVSAVVSAAASVPAASACSSRCFCSAVVMHCMLAPLVQVSQSVSRSLYIFGRAGAPSLLIVSIHSSYGSESKTMPPWCGWLAASSPDQLFQGTDPSLKISDAVLDQHCSQCNARLRRSVSTLSWQAGTHHPPLWCSNFRLTSMAPSISLSPSTLP